MHYIIVIIYFSYSCLLYCTDQNPVFKFTNQGRGSTRYWLLFQFLIYNQQFKCSAEKIDLSNHHGYPPPPVLVSTPAPQPKPKKVVLGKSVEALR